jgi:hypothetical protein
MLGMTEDPAAGAIEALRAHQEAMGMQFENPDTPVEAPDDGSGTPAWMTQDKEFR